MVRVVRVRSALLGFTAATEQRHDRVFGALVSISALYASAEDRITPILLLLLGRSWMPRW